MKTAYAADETGHGYVNAQAGYLWADADRAVEDDAWYGLSVGRHVSNEWSVEINGFAGEYDGNRGGTLEIRAFSIDALRVFRRASALSAFIAVGIGYIKDDPGVGDSEGNELAQFGAGLLIDLAANSRGTFVFQLRPEVKARWDFIDQPGNDRFLDYVAGVGIQFSFGSRRKSRAPQ